jgi:uncharacterized membrane protein YfcA
LTELAEASPWLIAGCALGLFAGGLVKGTIGIGLPLVAAPALASLLGVKQAITVLTLPVLFANIWQAWSGGHYGAVLRRFWSLILAMAAAIAVSTAVLVSLDPAPLFLLLAAVVIAYPLATFLRFDLHVDRGGERWASPLTGVIAGLLTGISYFFGPPLAIYFSALRLPKELFVAAIALIGLVAAALTALLLAQHRVLPMQTLMLSALAVVPTLAGTLVGTRLRHHIDETRFRKTVALVLLVIGANLLRRALALL